jgi:hypothetical protein
MTVHTASVLPGIEKAGDRQWKYAGEEIATQKG